MLQDCDKNIFCRKIHGLTSPDHLRPLGPVLGYRGGGHPITRSPDALSPRVEKLFRQRDQKHIQLVIRQRSQLPILHRPDERPAIRRHAAHRLPDRLVLARAVIQPVSFRPARHIPQPTAAVHVSRFGSSRRISRVHKNFLIHLLSSRAINSAPESMRVEFGGGDQWTVSPIPAHVVYDRACYA